MDGVSSTATGLNISIRDTPQSVSVLTRQQMDDRGMTTLNDAVRNITGLSTQKGYHAGDSDQFSARGFEVSSLLLDGLPISTGANGTFNVDNDGLDVYDRVEVVRGATGLITGTGNPSAAINLVRKRPTVQAQTHLTLGAGSWDNYRAVLDSGGSLNESSTLRARTVITAQSARQFFRDANNRNYQFYGIVEADFTPSTVATLGVHYRKVHNNHVYQGIPTNADGSFLSGISRRVNLANAFDYWKQTDVTVFTELMHQFETGWQLKAAATWKRPQLDMLLTAIERGKDGKLRQNSQLYWLDNRQDSYSLSLNGPFSLFGRMHELMLGFSHRKFYNLNEGGWPDYAWKDNAPVIDPYAWDRYAVPKPSLDLSKWGIDNTTRQQGTYIAARLNVADFLKIILGSRLDWYENINHKGGSRYKVTREITPYAGFVYDLDANHSVYASWTRIFNPQGHRDKDGNLLKPITGTNYELGIKGEYLNGRLNASLAAFLIRQRNRAVDDLAGPKPCPGGGRGYCKRAAGEVESRGVEFEISGAVTSEWQIMAGYAYVGTKYTKDSNPLNVGKTFDATVPRHQFKLSTDYQLPGDLQRWRIGGSLYMQSRTRANDDSGIKQSGYVIVGLHASYSPNKNLDFRMNINNLFDKHYYQSLGWTEGGNAFGTPRNVMLTAQYRF
ncbi:TonB-dependent siderophore receptor [Oligella sp. MSHR50489EDL]|uniref:TonB-dependent siderophore receptor n=1 Tax=Oligella sp. MSHR50489EDL TaxID=3139409 RepID=UPI003D819CC3